MKKTSIRNTMLFSFSGITLVSVVIFLLIALNYTERTVMDNAIENTTRLVNQVSYDVDSYISYMSNITTMISENEDVSNYLFAEDLSASERSAAKEKVILQFESVLKSRPDIYNLAIVENNDNYLINDGEGKLNPYVDVTAQNWFADAMKAREGNCLSSSHVQNSIMYSYKWVITMSSSLRDRRTNEKKGVFFIDLNYSSISDLCNNNKIGNKGYMFVMSEDGKIVYHPKQQLIYGGLFEEDVDKILSSKESYFTVDEGDNQKLYTICKSEETGWIVVGTAYTSELLKNSKNTQMIYIIIAACMILLVLIISSMIAETITYPIEVLKNSMQKVEQGQFDQANVVVKTKNEIGSLSNSFNIMTQQIQNLMEENVYEQKQKRKSELRALQSQINPHFLYNTLDSIIWMAESGKNDEVVEMTAALAKLLRQSISNEDEEVLLSQEIQLVQNYLTIQKMRYKDKLEYEITVDAEVANATIIKLLLQPLVENAIYHGLKYKESKGMLWLKAYRAGSYLCIEIQDDGVGMDEDTLKHIFEKHKVNYRSNGVGVYNVRQRLELYYGKECSMTYESKLNQGTKIMIRIPLRGGEEHD